MNFDMQDIDDYIQKYFEVPMSHLNLNIDKLIQEVNDE